jgi:hypothetical protein
MREGKGRYGRERERSGRGKGRKDREEGYGGRIGRKGGRKIYGVLAVTIVFVIAKTRPCSDCGIFDLLQ